MKNMIKRTFGVLLFFALCSGIFVTRALAVTFNFTAEEADVTMPDGETVRMWGFVNGTGTVFDYTNNPPVIRATTADTLTISLTNNLGVQTSIVIPGQTATTMVPTWTDGTTGARGAGLTKRVRSFTHETAATATVGYSWTSLKAGTYLIQSGTHPGIQVPMGLYAVLIVDQGAAGTAYTGQPYDNDVPLLFSEVDPYLNAAVAAGTYGTTAYPTTMAMGYRPRYFLLNGKPHSGARSPIDAGATGQTTLLRFLNAGLRDRQVVVAGSHMRVIAEDGNLFTVPEAVQYSVDLPPGKTMDAVFTNPVTAGYIPVYDRRLALTNNNAEGPGGMMAFLQVGIPDRLLTAGVVGTGSVQMVSAPGGVDTAIPDTTESLLDGAFVTLRATPAAGFALTGWTVTGGAIVGECADLADCTVRMDADKTVTATFTDYSVATGTGAVTLITPNGGELLPSGSAYTVRWGAPVEAVSFSLAYSFGAGTPWQTIATGVAGNHYVFAIPEAVPNHGDLYIAVIGYNAAGAKVGVDVSDAAAQRSSVAITYPSAAGLVLTNGATENITWSTLMVSETVDSIGLWYQTAPGAAWILIEVLQTDPGTYAWTVPNTVTTTARVGLIFYNAQGEPVHIDVSDNVFEIN